MDAQHADNPHGVVMTYSARQHEPRHEQVVHMALAQRLAALLGMGFAGHYDAAANFGRRVYLVPSGTLVGTGVARMLGVEGPEDLFGGVVPMPYMATKAITHPLVQPGAAAPKGWSGDFAARVRAAVLPGFSAFALADAREAGLTLLAEGPVRVKRARATGGHGQTVVQDAAALDAALSEVPDDEVATAGLVLETDLRDTVTYSVGQLRVGDLLLSYAGVQRPTRDNQGAIVYGGSDLVVVRGGFATLLGLNLPPAARHAVAQAQVYDAAANACYSDFFASRRNYDTIAGVDHAGRPRSGVLEQSWRVGGASPAEVAALELLHADPTRRVVRVACVETYGKAPVVPAGARILFDEEDPDVGPITKYVVVDGLRDPW